jgi:hypothetical protein
MPAIVTRDSLKQMLVTATPERQIQIIGRALVRIFEGQTAAEKAANTTDVDNGIGFSGADAKAGTLTAKYFLKHKTLLQWQVTKWMQHSAEGYPRICKYHKQLNAIAEAKASNQALPA